MRTTPEGLCRTQIGDSNLKEVGPRPTVFVPTRSSSNSTNSPLLREGCRDWTPSPGHSNFLKGGWEGEMIKGASGGRGSSFCLAQKACRGVLHPHPWEFQVVCFYVETFSFLFFTLRAFVVGRGLSSRCQSKPPPSPPKSPVCCSNNSPASSVARQGREAMWGTGFQGPC